MPAANLPPLPDLPYHLANLLAQVPAGRVTTYGDLAKALGDVVASRWVASFFLHDERSNTWPTHRVLRGDGSLGLYAHGGEDAKAERLADEDVAIVGGKVNLDRYGVRDFQSTRPFEALRRIQDVVPGQCSLQPEAQPPRTIAGLDVSYAEGRVGVGGYALVDVQTAELIWSTTVRCQVDFPYISSYLSFRELPVLMELLAAARAADRIADIYLIDGAGIMHPRRAGVATHFGVLADVPTIGVTKKLLAGSFDARDIPAGEPRDVTDGGELLGTAIRPRESSKKFIWISPGHRCDVTTASEVVLNMLRGRRLPEPIYWADRISRQACSH